MVEDDTGEQNRHKLATGHHCCKEQRSKALDSVDNKQLTWCKDTAVSKRPQRSEKETAHSQEKQRCQTVYRMMLAGV